MTRTDGVKTVEVTLKCEQCNRLNKIRRRAARTKRAGHRKHLHCVTCNERTRHVELAA